MNTELKIGMLVYAQSELSHTEGKIRSIRESTGVRKGLLYEVGYYHYFFEDEIKPIAMPTIYEHIATEMLRRDCWQEDKRILQLSINNPNFTFGKKGRGIVVGLNAYGKHFERVYTLKDIRYQFSHWRLKDQPSYIWATNPSYYR